MSYSNVNCNYRKAKLPVEMELEGSSIPDGSEMAEDDLPVLEEKMKQMMKFKEHLFKDAKANSLATNKTMTINEVLLRYLWIVYIIKFYSDARVKLYMLFRSWRLVQWCCSGIASEIQRRATK